MGIQTLPTNAPRFRGIVTALPSSPVDGDQCVYVDSTTAPTYVWQLVYDANQSAANKWLCIGGTALAAEVSSAFAGENTSSTSYTNLTTTGPTITLPLAGDYEIGIFASACYISTGTGAIATMSYQIGGTGALDTDGVWGGEDAGALGPSARLNRKTGFSASTALTMKYRASVGTAVANFYGPRRITAMPVRVG